MEDWGRRQVQEEKWPFGNERSKLKKYSKF